MYNHFKVFRLDQLGLEHKFSELHLLHSSELPQFILNIYNIFVPKPHFVIKVHIEIKP